MLRRLTERSQAARREGDAERLHRVSRRNRHGGLHLSSHERARLEAGLAGFQTLTEGVTAMHDELGAAVGQDQIEPGRALGSGQRPERVNERAEPALWNELPIGHRFVAAACANEISRIG